MPFFPTPQSNQAIHRDGTRRHGSKQRGVGGARGTWGSGRDVEEPKIQRAGSAAGGEQGRRAIFRLAAECACMRQGDVAARGLSAAVCRVRAVRHRLHHVLPQRLR